MHRHHAQIRQKVVQDTENRFLDLAGIARTAHQNRLFLQIDQDGGLGVGVVGCGIGVERGYLQHGIIGLEILTLLGARHAEHVLCKEIVPSLLGDDANLELVGRISAGDQVLHEQFPARDMLPCLFPDAVSGFGVDRFVDLAPVDAVTQAWMIDEELVVG